MSSSSKEDDLFSKSTMTFGEHLEELRKCLFKAVIGLAAGFILGLMVGSYVVQFIQQPLSRALESYYKAESVRRVEAETEKLAGEGKGESLPWTKEQVEQRVEDEGLLAEEVYIDLLQVLPELKRRFPQQFADVTLPTEAQTPEAAGGAAASQMANMIRMYLWRPSGDDPRMRIKSLNAQEPFLVYVKASLMVGILISSPWVFYQIWSFIAAGLYPHERHYVQLYLPFSIGLFLAGAATAFFVVFEPVLEFLMNFNRLTGIAPEPRINEWLSFVLILPVGFGLGFQLPLVMLFLERISVFSIEGYLKQWRIAVLVIAVIAALIMPPDPMSMIVLTCSLTLLYFGGILLCKLMPKRKSESRVLVPMD